MNLHHLRIFYEIAVTGSVTQAAERLLISQPAVSAQIRRFEAKLGVTLLRPEGRGVRLTEAGIELSKYARRVFALEREAERRLSDLREGRMGTLRIGGTNLPGHYVLPELMARFKRQHPGIEVHLQNANSRTIFDRLHACELDLALMAGGWEEPGIQREMLCEDELWFIVSPEHRLAGQEVELEELVGEPFLLREEGSSTRQRVVSLFEMRGLPLRVGLVFAGLLETTRAVAAGYGVAVVPSLAVRELAVARVRVRGVQIPFSLSVCRREDEVPSATAGFFLELARAFVIR